MKNLILIAVLSIVMMSCGSNCVSFNSENVTTLKNRIDSSQYSEVELALLSKYLMSYVMMHPDIDLKENMFLASFQKSITESGFKDCNNICEVFDFQLDKLESKGISEDDFLLGFKKENEKMKKSLEEINEGIDKIIKSTNN